MNPSVTSAFDSGNALVLATEAEDVRVAIRPDEGSDFLQWFHFRVDGIGANGCRFVIENAGETTYPRGWEGYGVATSTDLVRWYRTPADFDGKALSWRVEPRPAPAAGATSATEGELGSGPVWFAYFAPYSIARHETLVARSAAAPGVTLERLGETLDGRAIDCLHVARRPMAGGAAGDVVGTTAAAAAPSGRFQVWAIARQHPGESMAEWWMEGWLERLLDPDDATSRALRAIADIHVVPNMNPDGTFRGHLRTNAAGANLNREWAEPSLERSPEVFHVRRRMAETGVDLALDVHGDEALPYNFIAGTEGVEGWNEVRDAELVAFKRTLAALNPDFQVRHGYPRNRPGAANPSFASNHVAATYGCLAMTLEMPFKDTADTPRPDVGWSPERSVRLGRSFVDAVYLALTGRLLPAA